jgi:hypothetical protein
MELNIVDDTEAKRGSAKTRTKTRSKWPALLLLLLSVAFGASGCADSEMWIPQGNSRPGVTREHVQFLDSPPQRPYMVIGIITPPSGEYETVAEAVNAMRKVAARHGADAIYIESQTGSWRGGSGGSLRDISFRAKAIVWSAQREAKARSESEKRQETRTGRPPKIGEAEATSSPSPLTPASAEPMFPTAKAVPDKPGYVFSPFDTKGRYIDVSGYPPGSQAKDPWTNKIFIVP